MKPDYSKTGSCYCYTCGRHYHAMGIARHRAAHRDKKERCKIRFTYLDVKEWRYDLPREKNIKGV